MFRKFEINPESLGFHSYFVLLSASRKCRDALSPKVVETQNLALLSQQFFNIASKGMFSWVVLTDCYISNKYGQSVQSFFCAPITELCRVMSSFSAACSVSDTLTRFAKS